MSRPRLLLAVPLLLALSLAGCLNEFPEPAPPEPVFRDIHGLAVHPQDAGMLFVATHAGLFLGNESVGFARVGPGADDLMGFALHPHDARIAWSSGHPAQGGGALGARISEDGGATWRVTGLQNVDLHAMAVSPADPARVWGQGNGRLFRTDDGGRTWAFVSDERGAAGLAAHPTERDTLFAADGTRVWRSADAGATWAPFADERAVGRAVGLALSRDATLLLTASTQGVRRSADGGLTWEPARFEEEPRGVTHVAMAPGDPSLAWAGTYDGVLFKSEDGGRSFRKVDVAGRA